MSTFDIVSAVYDGHFLGCILGKVRRTSARSAYVTIVLATGIPVVTTLLQLEHVAERLIVCPRAPERKHGIHLWEMAHTARAILNDQDMLKAQRLEEESRPRNRRERRALVIAGLEGIRPSLFEGGAS